MANEEHVEVVRRGAAAIEAWRKENPRERLYLCGADLSGTNLHGAILHGANLSGANLSGADLSGANVFSGDIGRANLTRANLSGADLTGTNHEGSDLAEADLSETNLRRAYFVGARLSGANLQGARLDGTILSQADLSQAKLIGADIYGANLKGAALNGACLCAAEILGGDLSGADFNNAFCGSTRFVKLDLSKAKGLENIVHLGPSEIAIGTLYTSQGRIPEAFLLGCGVPDEFITHLPSILGDATDFYSCLIMHSNKDEEFCRLLHSRMRREHLRVWYAPRDMKSKTLHELSWGAHWVHDKLLLVLSEASMSSEWMVEAIHYARMREEREAKRVLFPIRLTSKDAITNWQARHAVTGKEMAQELRGYSIHDFSNWTDRNTFEQAFHRLLEDLRPAMYENDLE